MTQDNLPNWFESDALINFKSVLVPRFANRSARYLQVGSYTGDASVWIYENILRNALPESVLIDVDTWEGSQEVAHYDMDWGTVERTYDAKTQVARLQRKIIKYKGTSDGFFRNNRERYDFIYIDGDHTSYGVMKDAVSAYEVLNVGGIMAFDDYRWTGKPDPADRPGMAINAFLEIYRKRIKIIVSGYQLWVEKIG